MPQNIDSILDAAEQRQASDVFLQESEIPRLKINEQIVVLGEEPMSLAQMTAFWQACGANAQGNGDMDRDSGFISRTQTRYRVNLHRTMGRLGAVLRRIKTRVPSLKTLGAPEWLLTRWGAREHGLILVTGPTGSGKSTTSASPLQWMNENAGAMRDWIARRELQNIDQYIARGSDPAAVSFLQSTIKALQAKIITEATAMASVSNESELRRAMRGIG